MVFDVPAESGGALSILNEYYENAVNQKNKNIEWIFVVSKPRLESRENVKILRYPWIKKSWFHRLYFDYFIAHKLVKKYSADKVLSLQNLTIPRVKGINQTLYVHQSLPFVDYRFKFIDDKKLWVYQNIIGKGIINSIKKADNIIVQTEWMKEKCLEMIKVDKEKIEVRPPQVNIEPKKFYNANSESRRTFFYPAGSGYYKNHRVIVDACEELLKEATIDFHVIFTLKGDETDHITSLYSKTVDLGLPISFIGQISREEVFEYYTKSILVFPSYIETFGLPMLEAKLHKGMILASDCSFSREILDDYENALFFNPFNSVELKNLMFGKIK